MQQYLVSHHNLSHERNSVHCHRCPQLQRCVTEHDTLSSHLGPDQVTLPNYIRRPGPRCLPGPTQNLNFERRSVDRVQCVDGVSMYLSERSGEREPRVLLARYTGLDNQPESFDVPGSHVSKKCGLLRVCWHREQHRYHDTTPYMAV
jgi:hypothetical protein